MNYCRKCQSDYSTPGTCNCFAPIRVAPRTPVVPSFPPPPVVPYIGDPPTTPYWKGIRVAGPMVTNDLILQ